MLQDVKKKGSTQFIILSALLQDHFAVQDLKIKWYIVELKVLSYYAGRAYFLKGTYRLRGEQSQHPCVDPE